MAVAKRQEREKPVKMEQKKIHRPEWDPQVKKTALLASPVCIGQGQGPGEKCIKRGSQDRLLQDRGTECGSACKDFWRSSPLSSLPPPWFVLRSNNREGTQLCPSTENWIKNLLSLALPLKTRPSFPLSQSLPSGSFHKPLILLHQRADRLKTTIIEN